MKLPILSGGRRANSPSPATSHAVLPLASGNDYQLCYATQAQMTLALWNLSVQICPGGKVTSTGPESNGWCIHWHCP
jgi:hypothetical protein